VFRAVISAALALAAAASAQTVFFPLKDLKPGMRGVGKTVFSGDRIEEFQVEILGVLENIGPKQSLILGRLSGGPLEKTGVLQGMSGSPVYIDGKLAGALDLRDGDHRDYSAAPPSAAMPVRLQRRKLIGLAPSETENVLAGSWRFV
jgi:SpoIVB peptidase S55